MSNMERIAWMDKTLRNAGCMKIDEVCRVFEVSGRQVKRDIEYMRNRLDAPVEWVGPKKWYVYSKPFDGLQYADSQRLLFSVMMKSLARSEWYLPFVSDEILKALEKSMGPGWQKIIPFVEYRVAVHERIDPDHLELICHALRNHTVLKGIYASPGKEPAERWLEVHRLKNYMGKWYLVAWDQENKDLRTWLLSRFRSLEDTGAPLSWLPPGDSGAFARVEAHESSGFGVFHGNEVWEACIRFTTPVSEAVAPQVWHEDQQDRTGGSGADAWLERRLPVTGLPELLGRILSFGARARPLEPPELVQEWEAEIRALSEMVRSD